ncbi:MAG: zinc ribbon domain-containing protein [Thermodesulfobacteriota bacterium]
MPIYEYFCSDCNKDVSILFLSFSEAIENNPACPDCGNKKLERLLSKVSIAHNKKEPDTFKTPTINSNLEDPKSLADTMNKTSSNSKADYGDDFREVAGRLKKGESATSIEKKLRKRVGETMETH